MATPRVTKELTTTALTNVQSLNVPLYVEDYRDYGVLVSVSGASNGDKISVNLVGGLGAEAAVMETMPMIGCPLTVTIADGRTSQLFTLNLRGISFLQVKEMQTTGGSCTVSVFFGGGRR